VEEVLMEGHENYTYGFTDTRSGDEDALDAILVKLAEPVYSDTEIFVYKNNESGDGFNFTDNGRVFPEGATMVRFLGVKTRLSEGVPNILIGASACIVNLGGSIYYCVPRYPEWKD
jgi:hypothetical protein